MIRLLLFYFCCFYSSSLFSQALQGKIIDAETGKALSGASIYINNTSIGTMSDSTGSFQILNPVNGDLIASYIGYERTITPIQILNFSDKNFLLQLYKKQQSLEEVLLINDATRAKYLSYVKKILLGKTEEAVHCRIENLKDVYFVSSKDGDEFITARAEKPLKIYNKKLGYKIQFDLVDFEYNPYNGSYSYYGYTVFENLGNSKKHLKFRENSYYGSELQFFRSVISDSLIENGFTVWNIVADSSSKGYGNYKTITEPFNRFKLLKKDTTDGLYQLYWNVELRIVYNKKLNVFLNRESFSPLILHGNISRLEKVTKYILIDKYGYVINPMHLYKSGYWSMYSLANMLPFDYQPSP